MPESKEKHGTQPKTVEVAVVRLPPDADEDLDEDTAVTEGACGIEPLLALPPGVGGTLVVLQGPDSGREFVLSAPYNVIGRGVGNAVLIDDPAVSSQHAAVYFSESREWRVRDLGSTNGTLLNGSRVTNYALRSGDKLLVGNCLLRFVVS